jgi:hypothetical protein
MAQQMEFDETSSEQQNPSFHEYESGYRDPFIESLGQKVSPHQADTRPSAKQRLTLALVSLGVLLLLTLGALGFLTNGGHVITVPAIVLLCIIVGLFCFTTIFVNFVFATGHAD